MMVKFSVKGSRVWPPAGELENCDGTEEVSGGKEVLTGAEEVPGPEDTKGVVNDDLVGGP